MHFSTNPVSSSRRYIFVTGGVTSALGKGITCASIGRMLKNRGINVSIIKLDPYLNLDPGTMSPYEHGEVFVTNDGTETDLDLGHYERFLNKDLSSLSNVTAGQVYDELLRRERKGDDYLGQTVQVVPHLVETVARRIRALGDAESADVVIVEVGGTVGDMEAEAFIEAVRFMRQDLGPGRSFSLHLAFVPLLKPTNELKTKPTQHSVRQLRGLGIQPDAILCRLNDPTDSDEQTRNLKEKISVHCGVAQEAIIYLPTLDNVYAVPMWLEEQGLGEVILRTLRMDDTPPTVPEAWHRIASSGGRSTPRRSHGFGPLRGNDAEDSVTEAEVAIVGKYTSLQDSYLSVSEAVRHSEIHLGVKVSLSWVNASDIERDGAAAHLRSTQGIIVPGGFDKRGTEGMIAAAQFARENNIPYLGLCLGLQIMVIEFARNVLKIGDATSREFDEFAANPVIDLMESQRDVSESGGTQRKGVYPCRLVPGTLAHHAYSQLSGGNGSAEPLTIEERHRHRFEYNNDYGDVLESHGLVSSGFNPDQGLVEVAEISSHPFMLGSQFHPEFKSRPDSPHPLFNEFVRNAIECTPFEGQPILITSEVASHAESVVASN